MNRSRTNWETQTIISCFLAVFFQNFVFKTERISSVHFFFKILFFFLLYKQTPTTTKAAGTAGGTWSTSDCTQKYAGNQDIICRMYVKNGQDTASMAATGRFDKNLKRGIRSGMRPYGLCWTVILHSLCGRSCVRRTRSTIYGLKFLNSILPERFLKKHRIWESSWISNGLSSTVQVLESPSDEGPYCRIWAAFVSAKHTSAALSQPKIG